MLVKPGIIRANRGNIGGNMLNVGIFQEVDEF